MANVPAQAWCSTCGRPQPAGTPLGTTYCAWCSRRAVMLPYQPEMLTAPAGRKFRGVLTVAVIVAVFVAINLAGEARIASGPDCAMGQAAAAKLHPVFYSVMEVAVGQITTSCPPVSLSWYLDKLAGNQPVDVTWQYQGATYDALYYVDSLGRVTAGNVLAVELDKAASSAGSGLGMLLH